MSRSGGSQTTIGVDVGSRSIKVAQLSMSRGKPCLTALAMLPRARVGEQVDTEEVMKMKRLLRRQGIHGNEIVLAAPDEGLIRGIFDVPPVSGSPAAQIARVELSRTHNVAPDSFEMICWSPPEPDKPKSTVQTVAVGCPHDVADAFIDLFEDCGFRVKALDLRIAAAARACMALTAPRPALTSILDIGWESTGLLLVCGSTVVYERPFRSRCLALLRAKLSETFAITEDAADQVIHAIGFATGSEVGDLDQKSVEVVRRMLRRHFDVLLEELDGSFDYVNYQHPRDGIRRLLLIGGGARISGLSEYFHSTLGVDVRSVAPGDVLVDSPRIFTNVGHPAMTVALGLAMFTGE